MEGQFWFPPARIALINRTQAGVVEWLMAPGCKPGERKLYVGSNPTPCTIEISDLNLRFQSWAGVAQLVEHQPSKLRVASSSLVARSNVRVGQVVDLSLLGWRF